MAGRVMQKAASVATTDTMHSGEEAGQWERGQEARAFAPPLLCERMCARRAARAFTPELAPRVDDIEVDLA